MLTIHTTCLHALWVCHSSTVACEQCVLEQKERKQWNQRPCALHPADWSFTNHICMCWCLRQGTPIATATHKFTAGPLPCQYQSHTQQSRQLSVGEVSWKIGDPPTEHAVGEFYWVRGGGFEGPVGTFWRTWPSGGAPPISGALLEASQHMVRLSTPAESLGFHLPGSDMHSIEHGDLLD